MKFNSIWRSLAVTMALLVAVPAFAAERPGFEAYMAAADAFDRLAAASAAKGQPPRAADPEVAALLRTLSDADAAFEDRKFVLDDMEGLVGIMRRALGISALYAEFGASPTASDMELRRLSDRNLVTYQAEMTPLMTFVLDTTVAIAEAVEGNLASVSTTEQRSGAFKIRQGVSDMAPAVMAIAAVPGLTPENRLLVAKSLSRNASSIARVLTITQRKGLIQGVRSARLRAGPQAQSAYDALLTALAGTSCEGLCAL
jgi:hypothetical protein